MVARLGGDGSVDGGADDDATLDDMGCDGSARICDGLHDHAEEQMAVPARRRR